MHPVVWIWKHACPWPCREGPRLPSPGVSQRPETRNQKPETTENYRRNARFSKGAGQGYRHVLRRYQRGGPTIWAAGAEFHPGKRKGSFDRISHPSGSPQQPAGPSRPTVYEAQPGAAQALALCRACSARNSRKGKRGERVAQLAQIGISLLATPTLWETTAAADWHGGCQRYPLRGRMAVVLWASWPPARHRRGPRCQVPRQTATVPCPLQLNPTFSSSTPNSAATCHCLPPPCHPSSAPIWHLLFFPSALFLCFHPPYPTLPPSRSLLDSGCRVPPFRQLLPPPCCFLLSPLPIILL